MPIFISANNSFVAKIMILVAMICFSPEAKAQTFTATRLDGNSIDTGFRSDY